MMRVSKKLLTATKLLMAWDTISHPFLQHEHDRWRIETVIKDHIKYFEPIITLRPKEAKLLAAMAEAVGIPGTHGETSLDLQKRLPEHLTRHIGERLGSNAGTNSLVHYRMRGGEYGVFCISPRNSTFQKCTSRVDGSVFL